VEGGGPSGGIVGECCPDFMTSTNTYDPKGKALMDKTSGRSSQLTRDEAF
jgi:hypothetical protein